MRTALRGDAGSAVVETALVTVVLTALFLAVLQFGFVLYVRTTLIACAADGARYGANADRGPADAEGHARERITGSLPDALTAQVQAEERVIDGIPTMEVSVQARLPLVGLLGPGAAMTVTGHALEEAPAGA